MMLSSNKQNYQVCNNIASLRKNFHDCFESVNAEDNFHNGDSHDTTSESNANMHSMSEMNDTVLGQSTYMEDNNVNSRNKAQGKRSPLQPIDMNCSSRIKQRWPKGSKNQIRRYTRMQRKRNKV
jgi:hypothetical protein